MLLILSSILSCVSGQSLPSGSGRSSPKTPSRPSRNDIQSTPGFSAFRSLPVGRIQRNLSATANLEADEKSNENVSSFCFLTKHACLCEIVTQLSLVSSTYSVWLAQLIMTYSVWLAQLILSYSVWLAQLIMTYSVLLAQLVTYSVWLAQLMTHS